MADSRDSGNRGCVKRTIYGRTQRHSATVPIIIGMKIRILTLSLCASVFNPRLFTQPQALQFRNKFP